LKGYKKRVVFRAELYAKDIGASIATKEPF
jgi:hypothetical protein